LGHDQLANLNGRCKLGNIALWKNRALPAGIAQALTLSPYSLLDSIGNIPLVVKLLSSPLTITQSDTLSVSDSVAKLYNYLVKPTESITLVDVAIVPAPEIQEQLSDTLVFTDTLRTILGKGYQNFDILILLDDPQFYSPLFFAKNETLSLSDFALVYPVISVILDGDQLTFSDAVSTLIRGVYKVVESETLTIHDTLALSLKNFLALTATFAENILITESFLFKLTNTLGVFSDSITLGELIQILMVGVIKQNDNLSFSDHLAISAPEGHGLLDSFNIADSAGFVLSIILQFSETLFFSDVVTRFIAGDHIQLQFADRLSFSDSSVVNLQTIITSYLRQYLNDVI
jgi:hypothetical protein